MQLLVRKNISCFKTTCGSLMYKWWYCIGFMLERSTNLSMLVKDYFLFFPRDGDLALCRRSVNLSTHIQTALTMGTVLAKKKQKTHIINDSPTCLRKWLRDLISALHTWRNCALASWNVNVNGKSPGPMLRRLDMYRTAKSGSVWFVSLWIHFLSFFSPFFLISLKHREFPWQKNRFYARSCSRLGL